MVGEEKCYLLHPCSNPTYDIFHFVRANCCWGYNPWEISYLCLQKNHTNFNHSKLCQIPLYYPRLVGLPFNPSNSNRFPSTSKYFTKWYTLSSFSTNFSSSETKSYGLEKMLAVWMASLLLIESWLSSGGNFQWIHSDLRIQGHVHYVLIFLCIYRNNVIIHIKNS